VRVVGNRRARVVRPTRVPALTGARVRACIVAAAVVAPLAACSAPAASDNPAGVIISTPGQSSDFHGTVLAEPYHKPSLVFTAMDGRTFRIDRDARRAVVLVFFGYTNCPDVCTTVLADVAAALRPMSTVTRNKVQLLFITTDPARDTDAAMTTYLGRFDPSFLGLRAPADQTERVAESMGVAIAGTDPVGSGSGYTVAHGAQVVGFGPDNLAHVIWMPGTPVADLRSDVERLASSA
jgi:protein SCO1